MSDDHGLVTPEAVRLDLPEATVGSRGAAILVDWIAQAVIAFVLLIGSGFALGAPGLPEWIPGTIALVLTFLVVFGYPIGFETVTRGRTPGKMLLGLRVVTVEGAPVRFRHAAIRAALGLVDFGLTSGFGAVLSSLLSRRNQRLGDFAAGTVVLRERVAGGAASVRTFEAPPAAAGIADSIDVSGLTTRDYAAVRAFLVRADTLPPERRDAIADELLTAVRPRLGTLPAADLPAERLLETIAARYQQRASGRVDAGTSQN